MSIEPQIFQTSMIPMTRMVPSPRVPQVTKLPKSPIIEPVTQNAIAVTDSIITAINKIRAENNLPPLVQDKRLSQSAYEKSKDMIDRNYWSHLDPDGNMAWGNIKRNGYNYQHAGENMSRNFNDERSIEEWMKSPTHRANILNPDYTDIGIGRSGNINVLHFGREVKP